MPSAPEPPAGLDALRDALRRTGLPHAPDSSVMIGWSPHRLAPVEELHAAGVTAEIVRDMLLTFDMLHAFHQGVLDQRWTAADGVWAIHALGGPQLGQFLRGWFRGWRHSQNEHSATELLDAALSLRRHLRYRPPAPPALARGGRETFGWVAIDTARRSPGRDAAAWFALWRDDPDGRTAGTRPADWLHLWTSAGFGLAQASLPPDSKDRPSSDQLRVIAALRGANPHPG